MRPLLANIRLDGKRLPGKVLDFAVNMSTLGERPLSDQAHPNNTSYIKYALNDRVYMITCETDAITFEEE